jgi:hypothetical protein
MRSINKSLVILVILVLVLTNFFVYSYYSKQIKTLVSINTAMSQKKSDSILSIYTSKTVFSKSFVFGKQINSNDVTQIYNWTKDMYNILNPSFNMNQEEKKLQQGIDSGKITSESPELIKSMDEFLNQIEKIKDVGEMSHFYLSENLYTNTPFDKNKLNIAFSIRITNLLSHYLVMIDGYTIQVQK